MISNQTVCDLYISFDNLSRRNMTSYLVLLVVIYYFAGCKATTICDKRISMSYLDTAVEMIARAKYNLSTRADCKNSLIKGALDCSELLQMGHNRSGAYKIWPASRLAYGKSLDVYCDMQTDDGGWTLIQRRGNFEREEDYFYKDWKSYKEGFGNIKKDFWLGNDNIFALTNQKLYTVRFDLKDVEGITKYAQYDVFWIDDETNDYRLHFADYTGDAGDSLAEHNNNKFSTKDRENDSQDVQNCAQLYKGGWWYNACHSANPNGLYKRGKHESFADGVIWKTWKGYYESMESTEIKIRPKDFRMPQVTLI